MATSFVRPFVDFVVQEAENKGQIQSELAKLQVFDLKEINSFSDKEAKLLLQGMLTLSYSKMSVDSLSKKMDHYGYKIDIKMSTDFQMGAIGY